MDKITMKPELAQKKLWLMQWAIISFLGLAVFVIPLTMINVSELSLTLGVFAAAWSIIAILFLLWIPAYYRSLIYELDKDEIRMAKGVFWRKRLTVPFTKITNLDVKQGPVERMFHIGQLEVQTAGYSGNPGQKAELVLLGITDPDEIKDLIMDRVRAYNRWIEGVAAEEVAPNEADVLVQIHKELVEVRKLLEKK